MEKTISFMMVDRKSINRLKWILRGAGASKHYASWIVEGLSRDIPCEATLPNGKVIRILWDNDYCVDVTYL